MANDDFSKKYMFSQEQYKQWAEDSRKSPLPRRSILFDENPVEVFGLPGFEENKGRYVHSGTSASAVAKKGESAIRWFLSSKSPLALPHKGFESADFSVEGSNKTVVGYPSQIVSDFWLYLLSKGNLCMAPILSALNSTSLDVLADKEFGINRATSDYAKLIRDRIFTVEAVEYKTHFFPAYYDELHRIFRYPKQEKGRPIIFAKVTRDCFYSLFPGKANDWFDAKNADRTFYNHQFLTKDGNAIFDNLMNSFLTFLRSCPPGNWTTFKAHYQNVYGDGYQGALDLDI